MEEEEGSGGRVRLEKTRGNIFQHRHLLVTAVCVVVNLVLFHLCTFPGCRHQVTPSLQTFTCTTSVCVCESECVTTISQNIIFNNL